MRSLHAGNDGAFRHENCNAPPAFPRICSIVTMGVRYATPRSFEQYAMMFSKHQVRIGKKFYSHLCNKSHVIFFYDGNFVFILSFDKIISIFKATERAKIILYYSHPWKSIYKMNKVVKQHFDYMYNAFFFQKFIQKLQKNIQNLIKLNYSNNLIYKNYIY